MNMNEIIIVGSRYGELASVVKPLYAMMTPVAQTDIKEKLGGDVVYLSPTDNQFDDDAVGVFTVSQQLLGYVWMYQSYGLKQMLRNSGKRYVKAQISRMNTTFGLLMATSDGSWTLDANVQDNTIDAPTWAVDLPEVLTSMTSQSLTLGLDLLSDELRESAAWSDRLRQRVDNVLRHLPLDLSASHCQECMEVYRQMKQSTIAEVRQHSELLLQTLVSRGSQQQMEWWTEHWLTDFFASAASGDLLRLYEADGWTLERVEELLRKAPERLFQLYLVNKYRFATHLYYSRLSQRAYDRLLTLLAVREAMLAKQSSDPAEKREAEREKAFVASELRFFDMSTFGTDDMQPKLIALLQDVSRDIDTNNGRSWFVLYAGYRYYKQQLAVMGEYVDFFTDIERLQPNLLTKTDQTKSGSRRYAHYAQLLGREAKLWFMDNGRLPPLNEITSWKNAFDGDKNRFEKSVKTIVSIYKRLKTL